MRVEEIFLLHVLNLRVTYGPSTLEVLGSLHKMARQLGVPG